MTAILCIDDKKDNLRTMSAILKAHYAQCRVLTAQSGAEGLEKAKREKPDTILLDIKMPGMDGFEVCEQLKADPGTKHIPVIMVTAIMTGDQSRAEGLERGADAFLAKPVDESVLLAQVNSSLRIKKAEDALRQQKERLASLVTKKTQKLSESQAVYQALVESYADHIFMLSPEGVYLSSNTRAEQFGIKDGKHLVGRHVRDVYPSELADYYLSQVNDVVSNGRQIEFEHSLQHAEGSLRYHQDTLYPIYKGDGALWGIGGICRDITEQKAWDEEKERLQRQLQQAQKMEAIGTLAGGIAHDFNNILSAVLGFTDLALAEVHKESHLHEDLCEVRAAGNRAKDLVNQILTISRHEPKEVKPIQVAPLVKEALKMLRSTIPTSIEIREKIGSEPLIVQADPTQLHQVVVNLATNAKQAMPEQEGIMQVCLDAASFAARDETPHPDLKPGRYARLTITDTGCGIPKDHVHKIFEPYFTTKEKGTGTGLGLSVVHGIVTSYKGHIEVRSEPAQGTTFQVYLPLLKKVSEESEARTTQPLPTGTEHILCVDDEPAVLKMLIKSLQSLGYTVTSRNSSQEALETFRSSPEAFDLMITDMTMPHMTGDKLAAAIKDVRADIPVILCTGFSEKINAQSDPLQVDTWLMKPVDQEDMARAIRRVLKG